jgi:small subunit ribosomal protein S25e
MGGKKKIGLKQMERQQSKQDQAKDSNDKKKDKAAPPKEKRTIISVVPPDAKNDKIVAEIKKMNVLTPYQVATRYGIRISAAKDFLEQLEQNGAIELVLGSHDIKIYKPAAA